MAGMFEFTISMPAEEFEALEAAWRHESQLEMLDDPVHHGIICEEGDDVHFSLALGTGHGNAYLFTYFLNMMKLLHSLWKFAMTRKTVNGER